MVDETNALVTVIAQCRSRAGAGDEVASLLAAHLAASQAEAGCISFRRAWSRYAEIPAAGAVRRERSL
jgi:quinol monooxygenase YgiN